MKPKPSDILEVIGSIFEGKYYIDKKANSFVNGNNFKTEEQAQQYLNKLDMASGAIEALKDIAYWTPEHTEIWGEPALRAKEILDKLEDGKPDVGKLEPKDKEDETG